VLYSTQAKSMWIVPEEELCCSFARHVEGGDSGLGGVHDSMLTACLLRAGGSGCDNAG